MLAASRRVDLVAGQGARSRLGDASACRSMWSASVSSSSARWRACRSELLDLVEQGADLVGRQRWRHGQGRVVTCPARRGRRSREMARVSGMSQSVPSTRLFSRCQPNGQRQAERWCAACAKIPFADARRTISARSTNESLPISGRRPQSNATGGSVVYFHSAISVTAHRHRMLEPVCDCCRRPSRRRRSFVTDTVVLAAVVFFTATTVTANASPLPKAPLVSQHQVLAGHPLDRAPAMSGPASGTASQWAVQHRFPAPARDLFSFSCPSSSACWAVGDTFGGTGAVLATTNGRSWTAESLPGGIAQLGAVSCPNTNDCWASGKTSTGAATVIATTDGGHTWRSQTLPSGSFLLNSVSCPTSSDCWAVGVDLAASGLVLATKDGGHTWNLQTVPNLPSSFALFGVSCPTSSHCWAVGPDNSNSGVAIATTDGGQTWNAQTIPTGVSLPEAVSCPTISACWAVGLSVSGPASIVATVDGGATWNTQTAPSEVLTLADVSCSTVNDCLAVGSTAGPEVAVATTNGGTTWVIQDVAQRDTVRPRRVLSN
jgi:photosystem II stability/assembly factor-like uncharacterized protein